MIGQKTAQRISYGLRESWRSFKILSASSGVSALLGLAVVFAAGPYQSLDHFMTVLAWMTIRALSQFLMLYPALIVLYFCLGRVRVRLVVSNTLFVATLLAGAVGLSVLTLSKAPSYAWFISMLVLNVVFIQWFEARFPPAMKPSLLAPDAS
jgi:hypothetical protein